MEIGTYYVGAKPARPLRFKVRDSAGEPVNLLPYTNVQLRMLDDRNREVDLRGADVVLSDPQGGEALFLWPSDSVFKEPGEYVLQLRLESATALDFTTEGHILVKEMGVYDN